MAIFPFGHPFPTTFYLVLYVVTLIGHVVFMNYVLAGCCYLAFAHLFPGRTETPRHKQPLADLLSDWMPFAISAAITMGVAPLLFIQILYKERFYTANLLLFHRWMVMLPILILGFYLVYVVRSWRNRSPARITRYVVVILTVLCFLFAAASWAENHLLSLNREIWPTLYASSAIRYRTIELIPRLAMWIAGAFPTLCVLVAWQFQVSRQYRSEELRAYDRRLATIALVGMVVGLLVGSAYFLSTNRALTTPGSRVSLVVYAVIALAGLGMQAIAWLNIHRNGFTGLRPLIKATLGLLLTLTGVTVVRELNRLSRVDIQALYPQHANLFQSGGFWAFVIFAVINLAIIACCIRLVRRAIVKSA